jgi:hypothetical protein
MTTFKFFCIVDINALEESNKRNVLAHEMKIITLFIHKYMPIEELSELKNILWTLEVKVQPRIPMILLARSTKGDKEKCQYHSVSTDSSTTQFSQRDKLLYLRKKMV